MAKQNREQKEPTIMCAKSSNLIINENYFSFNGRFFKQVKGVPMGSPISNNLAELKLRNLENKIMENFKLNIKYWYRYVDDVFAVINGIKPEELLDKLNEIDENIKFTLEVEKSNSINYLDVKLLRENCKIETTVYRKPEAINEIINAKCSTPKNYKLAALRSYINRAITVCSNQSLLEKEIKVIKEIANKAGYKSRIINKLFNRRIKILNTIQPAQKENNKYTNAIPFDKGASLIIKKEAAKLNLFIPIKPNKSIFQRIRNEKDLVNNQETAGIYKVDFIDQNKVQKSYIGMTKRKISQRIKEHENDIKFERMSTALSQENLKNCIKIDFKNTRKLANYLNSNYALKREAIEIISNKNAVNFTQHAIIDERWRKLLKTDGAIGEEKEEKRRSVETQQRRIDD